MEIGNLKTLGDRVLRYRERAESGIADPELRKQLAKEITKAQIANDVRLYLRAMIYGGDKYLK